MIIRNIILKIELNKITKFEVDFRVSIINV